MKVNQAYRYELDPNHRQWEDLCRYAGLARIVYNWGLGERNARFELMEGKEKFISEYTQSAEWTASKAEVLSTCLWADGVSSGVAYKALKDLDIAFKNFWRKRKTGGVRRSMSTRKDGMPMGAPRFKPRGRHDSFHLNINELKIDPKRVRLAKMGWVRTKEETDLKGAVKAVTVSREANHWFVSFIVERERPDPKPVEGPVVGIDMGLTSFVTMSDGVKIKAPKPLNRYLRKKRRLSKAVSRKREKNKRRTQNLQKAVMRGAQLDYRIKNLRRDFRHKLTTWMAKNFSVIVMEDLNVRGMMKNHHLARHITDVGWGDFRRALEYKAKWYGSRIHFADRFFPSSKMCSRCGAIKESLELKDRQLVCENCGYVIDRDLNAAINLRNLVAANQAETLNACGEECSGIPVRPECETILCEAGTRVVAA